LPRAIHARQGNAGEPLLIERNRDHASSRIKPLWAFRAAG
jgi:hypothetical protein